MRGTHRALITSVAGCTAELRRSGSSVVSGMHWMTRVCPEPTRSRGPARRSHRSPRRPTPRHDLHHPPHAGVRILERHRHSLRLTLRGNDVDVLRPQQHRRERHPPTRRVHGRPAAWARRTSRPPRSAPHPDRAPVNTRHRANSTSDSEEAHLRRACSTWSTACRSRARLLLARGCILSHTSPMNPASPAKYQTAHEAQVERRAVHVPGGVPVIVIERPLGCA